jgi:hypothetical protein
MLASLHWTNVIQPTDFWPNVVYTQLLNTFFFQACYQQTFSEERQNNQHHQNALNLKDFFQEKQQFT